VWWEASVVATAAAVVLYAVTRLWSVGSVLFSSGALGVDDEWIGVGDFDISHFSVGVGGWRGVGLLVLVSVIDNSTGACLTHVEELGNVLVAHVGGCSVDEILMCFGARSVQFCLE
jgi:hypothetical protein